MHAYCFRRPQQCTNVVYILDQVKQQQKRRFTALLGSLEYAAQLGIGIGFRLKHDPLVIGPTRLRIEPVSAGRLDTHSPRLGLGADVACDLTLFDALSYDNAPHLASLSTQTLIHRAASIQKLRVHVYFCLDQTP